MSRLAPLEPRALAYDKPLCASLDGFTLHAATRAGALDPAGREALLRYVLRPPVAQERVEQRPDGLVRITHEGLQREHRAAPRHGGGSNPGASALAGSRSAVLKSRVLRLKGLGDEDEGEGWGSGADEVALGA